MRPSPVIDYALLGKAVSFYEEAGYEYVEVPWAVDDKFVAATCPTNSRSYFCEFEDDSADPRTTLTLVGSAEQGFLSLALPTGRYVACTPCFRVEPDHSDLYQPWFMKVELFAFGDDVEDLGARMLIRAFQFMQEISNQQVSLVPTDIGVDIHVNDIEVGSYGVRKIDGYRPWAYGTGLALPRFSVANKAR